MFEITIKGATMDELAAVLAGAAAQFNTPAMPTPKARKAKATAPAPEPEPEVEQAEATDDVDAELLEEVPPAPATANQVVDAGTGKPSPETGAPIQMTMDDVKVAAAKLVAKDTPGFEKILKKYGAAKLSDVPKDKIGDFAADVMEALG